MLALIHSFEYSKVVAIILAVCLVVLFQAEWNTVPVEEPTCLEELDIADIPFECSQNAIVRDAEAELETQLMVAEILPSNRKYSSILRVAAFFPKQLLYPFQILWRVPQYFQVRHVFIPHRKEDRLPALWDGQLDLDISDDQAWDTAGSILSPGIDTSDELQLDYFAVSPHLEEAHDRRLDYFGSDFVLCPSTGPERAGVTINAVSHADTIRLATAHGSLECQPLATHVTKAEGFTERSNALDHFMITGYGAWCHLDNSLEILSRGEGPSQREIEAIQRLKALEEQFPCLRDIQLKVKTLLSNG